MVGYYVLGTSLHAFCVLTHLILTKLQEAGTIVILPISQEAKGQGSWHLLKVSWQTQDSNPDSLLQSLTFTWCSSAYSLAGQQQEIIVNLNFIILVHFLFFYLLWVFLH